MRVIVAYILVAVILAAHQVYGQNYRPKCPHLQRHADRCFSYKDEDIEYECISEQNGLQAIMDCVTIEGGADQLFCRKFNDGNPDTTENYFKYSGYDQVSGEDICIQPRDALLLMSRNKCIECGLTGVLHACPMNDPCFLQCVCEYQVTDAHLWCLSNCFNTNFDPPKCSNNNACSTTRHKRQAARISSRDVQVENNYATQWIKASGLEFRLYYTGLFEYINIDGIAITSRYYLPFTDTLISRNAVTTTVRRCFVSPVSDILYCFQVYIGQNYRVPETPDRGHFTKTDAVIGPTKTLSDAYKTQSSVPVERAEVPTQKPKKKEDKVKEEKGEGDEGKEKGNDGASSCFHDGVSPTMILSVLILIGFVVV